MPERARRMMSFLLAAIAVITVSRVVLAYMTRPSRWTPRFAWYGTHEDAKGAPVELPAVAVSTDRQGAPERTASPEELVAITALRAAAVRAIADGDVEAYVRCFASDAVTFAISGRPIVGSQALAKETARTLRDADVTEVRAIANDLRILGKTVLEEGHFSIQLRIGEADVVSKGRYAALWKREVGDWRIVFEAVRADGSVIVEI